MTDFVRNGKATPGEQTYITFDGVYMDADVWINGHHLGNHPYGYTAFSYNLTDFLRPPGQPNVMAVRAKNLGKNSRWYAGSGIYRHVWLMAVNPLHTAINGTYVTTPTISPGMAQVSVESTLENMASQATLVEVQVDVVNPAGQIVASRRQSKTVAAKQSQSITQELPVKAPTLWTLDKPVLYTARVTLLAAGKILDQTNTPFGIRSLKFDGQKGFMLNGQVLKLKVGSQTLMTTGKPVAIRLVADRPTIKADQQDLSYVQVELIDEQGQVVPSDNDTQLTYQVTGTGVLAGVGNGNPADLSSFQQPKKRVYQGRGLVILRSTDKPGHITLNAQAPGLREAKLVITTQKHK